MQIALILRLLQSDRLEEHLVHVEVAEDDADGGHEHHTTDEVAELNVEVIEKGAATTNQICIVAVQRYHCPTVVCNGADVDKDDNPVDYEESLVEYADLWLLVQIKLVDVAGAQTRRIDRIHL